MLTFFGVARDKDEDSVDVWPASLAPFIRLAEPPSHNKLVVEDGLFGLIPGFKKEMATGRKTYNARSETVNELPSFRESWNEEWRCIIPAESIYEPNYEQASLYGGTSSYVARYRWGLPVSTGSEQAWKGIGTSRFQC